MEEPFQCLGSAVPQVSAIGMRCFGQAAVDLHVGRKEFLDLDPRDPQVADVPVRDFGLAEAGPRDDGCDRS